MTLLAEQFGHANESCRGVLETKLDASNLKARALLCLAELNLGDRLTLICQQTNVKDGSKTIR